MITEIFQLAIRQRAKNALFLLAKVAPKAKEQGLIDPFHPDAVRRALDRKYYVFVVG